MSYDIVIKNGMVVDGSGSARYRADVAIKGGKIAKIGRVNEKAKQTIPMKTLKTRSLSCVCVCCVVVV